MFDDKKTLVFTGVFFFFNFFSFFFHSETPINKEIQVNTSKNICLFSFLYCII